MKTENEERLFQAAEMIDNLIQTLQLEAPDDQHKVAVQETLPEIRTDLRSIYISETGDSPWVTDVADMSQEQLDELSDEFIGEDDQFANFETFWWTFLRNEPSLLEMVNLVRKLEGWAYFLNL